MRLLKKKIFSLDLSVNNVKEVAVAPFNEVEELGEEGIQEDTENSNKGIEEKHDDDDDVIYIKKLKSLRIWNIWTYPQLSPY